MLFTSLKAGKNMLSGHMIKDKNISSHGCETPFSIFLDDFSGRIMSGEKPDKSGIIRLLAIDPESAECDLLREKARELARSAAKNRGRVWSAVGIEHRPCSMNCKFCSFGEKWGLVKDEMDWSEEDIIKAARISVESGASWFTLRTNETYDVDRLCNLARKICALVPGDYALAVNTGELSPEDGEKLKSSGVTGVYHTWRLGEGKDTHFLPQTRLSTMQAISGSDLELYHMVEPLGPEHGNDEIADRIMAGARYGSVLGGVMARINVPGTPLENSGSVGRKRLSQIVAICRLCAGTSARDICVVPPSRECLEAGANVVTVEVGSIPRSGRTNHQGAWRGFGIAEAFSLLESAGYETRAGKNA